MTDKNSFRWYTNGIKTIKVYDDTIIPEGFYAGRTYKAKAWNKGLTAETDERVKRNTDNCHNTRKLRDNYVPWNKGLTKDTDERIKGNPGELNGMYGKHHEAWNKGLTKDTDENMRKASEHHKGCTAWNKGLQTGSNWNEGSALKSIETKKKNHSFGKSEAEDEYYEQLVEQYGKDNVIRQYSEKRYPFNCDFYIPSEDLFIEFNRFWHHGTHPFDPNNPEDILLLEAAKLKCSLDYKGRPNSYYGFIETWTVRDVKKINIAKQNNLNYKLVY